MAIDRLWLRAALRIRELYAARARKSTEQFLLDRLGSYDQALEATRAALREAAADGSSVRMLRVRQHLQGLVRAVREAVAQVLMQPMATATAVPDARMLLAEFRQLQDEFEDVTVDCRSQTLAATTEPINLEGVYLGPFRIRLNWERLAGDAGVHVLELEALEPNPSALNENVPHPHVNDGGLCGGDATQPIARALQQGRLADAFLLVRHVLAIYNPNSAYVVLDDWSGTECRHCGRTVSEDQSWRCRSCEDELCANCAIDCVACETGCSNLCWPSVGNPVFQGRWGGFQDRTLNGKIPLETVRAVIAGGGMANIRNCTL